MRDRTYEESVVSTYLDGKVVENLSRKCTPKEVTVPTDRFTKMVENNFDYEFTGRSTFYPFKTPNILNKKSFGVVAIVGASGSGKSTMVEGLPKEYFNKKSYDNSMAIVSNFGSPEEASNKLGGVGLNSMPVWCRTREVLSTGEGFRADVALNLSSNRVFDEFTSTIDRNVAKSTSKGIRDYINSARLDNVVFVSSHKDFIPYLSPDYVVDLDEEKVFDCRGLDIKKESSSTSIGQKTNQNGSYLGSIII